MLRLPLRHRLRQFFDRFANDLELPDDGVLRPRVGGKAGKIIAADVGLNSGAGIQDVLQEELCTTRHA